MSKKKIRVGVLYGGRSGEHEVSISSATNVVQYLDRSRFDVIPIKIDKQGVWFLNQDAKQLQMQPPLEDMLFKPDAIGKQLQQVQSVSAFSRLNNSERIFDVIFPVIHGTLCEDGTVQGLLELADIPYVGCGVLASAMGMDKDISKRLIAHEGIKVPPYLFFHQGEWRKNPDAHCERIIQNLSLPVFVKPANTGSSVGIEKVKSAQGLKSAIHNAFRYDTKVIIEKAIDAIELELAILESLEYGSDPIVSVVGEVRSKHEFYSYTAKYIDAEGAELFIPATVSETLQAEARETAKKIFLSLECEGLARVDLFIERHTNQIYFNEINTLPGFTQISMYPKLMNATGISYPDLLTHLVELAIQRHQRRSLLTREYATGENCA